LLPSPRRRGAGGEVVKRDISARAQYTLLNNKEKMGQLFTAVNVSQYRKLVKTKTFSLLEVEENACEFLFTEDKEYWIRKIKEQDDCENLSETCFRMMGFISNSCIKIDLSYCEESVLFIM
jgi:hypothetical protein